jgi:hypothetical protein
MSVRSLHPGVTMDQVRENTGFAIDGDERPTREPTGQEHELIAKLDPNGNRDKEVA